jgi:hypothetical protein
MRWHLDYELERLADQVVDEIDLRPAHVGKRHRVDDHHRPVTLDDNVIVSPLHVEVESRTGIRSSRRLKR